MHVGVLDRHSAEGNDQFAAPLDGIPGDALAFEMIVWPQDMRDDDHRSTGTVGIDGSHIPAQQVQKTRALTLRMMEPAGTAPSIGPSENRLWAMLSVNAPKFLGDKVQPLRPTDFHI